MSSTLIINLHHCIINFLSHVKSSFLGSFWDPKKHPFFDPFLASKISSVYSSSKINSLHHCIINFNHQLTSLHPQFLVTRKNRHFGLFFGPPKNTPFWPFFDIVNFHHFHWHWLSSSTSSSTSSKTHFFSFFMFLKNRKKFFKSVN